MLKVECESCKAPYQIDERRVPAAGLKMRCPKCGHSFVVASPGAGGAAPPAPPKPGPVTRPTKPEGMRAQAKTMVGVAPPTTAAAPPPPPPPVPPPPPIAKAPLPSDFPAVFGSLDEGDLPVVAPALPATVAKKPAPPPAAKPAPAPPPPPKAAPKAVPLMPAFGEIDADLPALVGADLPALAGADLPALAGADLPVVAAGLPAARAGAARATKSFESDLPVPAAGGDLPVPKRSSGSREIEDLLAVAAGLPAVSAGLPAVAAGLPSVSAGLPSVAAGLPSVSAGLPAVSAQLPANAAGLPQISAPLPTRAQERGFGEIDLPIGGGDPFGAPSGGGDPFGDFGELDLPKEHGAAASHVGPPPKAAQGRQAFGELDFEGSVVAQRRPSNPPGAPDIDSLGFGDPDAPPGGSIPPPVEAAMPGAQEHSFDQGPMAVDHSPGLGGGGFEASIPVAASTKVRDRPVSTRKSGNGKKIALAVVALLLVGGSALELLPAYGAFGRFVIQDTMNGQAYVAATNTAANNARKTLAPDTYEDAKTAVDQIARAHEATKRSRPLAAYAAFVDFEIAVRFGADGGRAARGKGWLAELPPNTDVQYLVAAQAAQAAAADDWDKARKFIDAASKKDTSDAIQQDLLLLRGEVELRGKDGAAALAAFQKAAQLAPGPRADFGIARAYVALANRAEARKAIEATLAASPAHAGAMVLRATLASGEDDAAATKDVVAVIDGAAKTKASPMELAEAYAVRGWMNLQRGGTNEARGAFEQAVKLNPRSIPALLGQGELFFREGRFTEALTRFDTALQVDKDSIDGITSSVKTQIALERLADAKNQLTAARERFPKEMLILLWLGRVESKLNNNAVAEQHLRGAVLLADPARRDAVLPYVWLSALLQSQAKVSEAQAVLEDARKKLPDSAALQRALGEVAEAQSAFDDAVKHYRAAIAKEPNDASTHFRLGSTLLKMKKFDEATKEFDIVDAADKDFPGLAIERGQLYEEAGDVQKAIDQFKAALAKAPDDPDLQLRVGSAYVLISRPDDAIPQLKKVLEKRSNSAEAHHYLGRAFMQKGRVGEVEALRELKKAVELDPNRAEFHFYLAWMSNEASAPNVGVARDEVEKAITLDKVHADSWWLRGQLECRSGSHDDGVRDVKKSLVELKNPRPEPHAALAECFELKNDPNGALTEWAKAVAGDAKRPFWHYRFGKLLLERGNTGEAEKHLASAALGMSMLDSPPGWAPQLEFSYATALKKNGKKAEAIIHFQRYIKIAPQSSPDFREAQQALSDMGAAPR